MSGSRSSAISGQSVPLNIVGGTTFARYKKQAIEETFNMIISDGALVPYSGYKAKIKVQDTGVSRGLFRSTKFNHLCTVIDNSFYIISENLSFNKEFTLDTQLGNVYFAENLKNQIAVVDGLFVYIFDYSDGGSFTKVTVPFLPVYIDFQDGYFIAADGASNRWPLSALNDGTSWPTTSVGALETKADIMVAGVQFNRQLFIIGRNTTEIWHDVGNIKFPYQRDNSLSIDYGCLSAATIASGFDKLVWLASNEKAGPSIVVSRGGEVRTLSTDGINFRLDKIEKPEDSTAFLFEEDGHVFYQITFKSDNATLVYDFETERFFTPTDDCFNAHIAKSVAFFNNTHYFVSYVDATLYELSTEITTIDVINKDGSYTAQTVPRVRMTKNFRLPGADRFILENVSLTLEQGNTTDLQKVDFSISRDGGESFGNIVSKELNKIGVRPNKLQYWQLGAANDAVFQFRFWSKSKFVIIGGMMRFHT